MYEYGNCCCGAGGLNCCWCCGPNCWVGAAGGVCLSGIGFSFGLIRGSGTLALLQRAVPDDVIGGATLKTRSCYMATISSRVILTTVITSQCPSTIMACSGTFILLVLLLLGLLVVVPGCWLRVLMRRISRLDDVLVHFFLLIGPSDGLLHCLGLGNRGNVCKNTRPKTFVKSMSSLLCQQGPLQTEIVL